MIPKYTAVQFRRPMKRGINRPFLVLAEREGEKKPKRVPLVVKSIAGYGDCPEAMVRELFTCLFAKQLGVPVPDAALVRFPDGLEYGAAEDPDYADLITSSPGWNFATVHLGESWKAWQNAAPPRTVSKEDIETAYCFDAMVQNSDREPGNPNLLWKRNELILIDFDKAFAYLRVFDTEEKPWRKALIQQNLSRHCLSPYLADHGPEKLLGTKLWEAFAGWMVQSSPNEISARILEDLADTGLDLPLLEDYTGKLSVHLDDFFRYLTELS